MSLLLTISDYVLFEDHYLLVINKPAGLMVEPDRNGHLNLLDQVKKYLRLCVLPGDTVYAQHLHRLDRPVSGIILFAKQRSVLQNLSEQFATRRVKKYYEALTSSAPAEKKGTLTNWLRKEKKKAVIYDHEKEYAEKVILSYQISEWAANQFLWQIELYTGKYHQIRAQLAHIGCPIIGDITYGSTLPWRSDAIALHAAKLIFFHPITNDEIVMQVNRWAENKQV